MTYTLLVISFVLVLMTIVIFFVLKSTINSINTQGKTYFALKLQKYEEENKEEIKASAKEEVIKKEEKTEKPTKEKDNKVVYVEDKKNYEVDDILKIVKDVNNKFHLDKEDIINNFIKNNTKTSDNTKYKKLIKIKEYINKIGMYEIIRCNEDKKNDIIKEITKIDSEFITDYQKLNEDNFEEILNYLNLELSKNDPTIYVIVGKTKDNYDYLDKRIKTVHSEKIYKGMRIIYKNKMYDYSLS